MKSVIIDLTPEGEFRSVPGQPLSARILRAALLVAVVTGGLAIAAFALWFALLLIPVAVGAAIVAYLAFRWRSARRQPGPVVRATDV